MDKKQSGRPTVSVVYTPAFLADGAEAKEEFDRVAADFRVSPAKRIEKEVLADLRGQGWLRQTRWRRGGYLRTNGLRPAVGSPELAMLNVPSVLAPWARTVMDRLAEYILTSGTRLQPGEVFALKDPDLPEMLVTFDLVEPGDIEQPTFDHTTLVVVPLP